MQKSAIKTTSTLKQIYDLYISLFFINLIMCETELQVKLI